MSTSTAYIYSGTNPSYRDLYQDRSRGSIGSARATAETAIVVRDPVVAGLGVIVIASALVVVGGMPGSSRPAPSALSTDPVDVLAHRAADLEREFRDALRSAGLDAAVFRTLGDDGEHFVELARPGQRLAVHLTPGGSSWALVGAEGGPQYGVLEALDVAAAVRALAN